VSPAFPDARLATVRRLAGAAWVIALGHVIFGGFVRISGSGMGCGDHWPKCYGYWFPPFSRPDLVIEVLHRYFAAALSTTVVAFLVVAFLRRAVPGVAGRGGVLRSAGLATGIVLFAATLGAVTVTYRNEWWATLAHKAVAMSLLATLTAGWMRAGGLSSLRDATAGTVSGRTVRGATIGAALALVTVLMGGMTAKWAGAAVACVGFPLCGEGSLGGGAQHIQLTHRVLAYLTALHVVLQAWLILKRGERPVIRALALTAASVVVLQIVWGAIMVLGGFPQWVRSAHQATGVLLWVSTFALAYGARRATGGDDAVGVGARVTPRPPVMAGAAEVGA
jgi:heme A synthase